jgi:hypothetical protein
MEGSRKLQSVCSGEPVSVDYKGQKSKQVDLGGQRPQACVQLSRWRGDMQRASHLVGLHGCGLGRIADGDNHRRRIRQRKTQVSKQFGDNGLGISRSDR